MGPSLLENQPTTIIYAARLAVPMLFFDTGGVLEMLAPTSREQCVIDPDPLLLASRLKAILAAGLGHVPVLHDAIVQARDIWTRFLQQALLSTAKAPVVRAISPFSPVMLEPNTTTDAVAAQLAALGPATETLLVLHAGYAVIPGEEAYLEALAARLADDASGIQASAFTGIVRWRNGRNLAPAGMWKLGWEVSLG